MFAQKRFRTNVLEWLVSIKVLKIVWMFQFLNVHVKIYTTTVLETIRKASLVKAQTALKNKKNKIRQKTIFDMADGIITPCNVARSWQISPGDCTLQCGMWLWNHDSEFTKWQHYGMWYVALGWHAVEFAQWQHPAMWHIAVGSWHWIYKVAAPCSVAGGSGMTCHGIRPNIRHIGILHLVSISTISLQSTCHSEPLCKILSKSDHPQQKKMTSIFKMADLSHLGF